MAENKSATLWRVLFAGILFSGTLAILDIAKIAGEKGFSLMQPKWLLLLIVIGGAILSSGALFVLTWTKGFVRYEASLDAFLRLSAKWKWILLPFLIITLFGVTILEVQPYLSKLFGAYFWTKIFFFHIFLFTGAFLLRLFFASLSWQESLVILALGQLFIYYFPTKFFFFTDYPFALGWTSDSRHYYASLFLAGKLYGKNISLPILHPSLHLLLSIPFYFRCFSLMGHRLWAVFLPWGLSVGVIWSFFKRREVSGISSRHTLFIGIWIFLYIARASVYAHLLLPTLLIFLFVSPKKKWQSWVAIIVASLWAGISRINWFPVPALLASLIYLLELPQNERNFFDYIKLPALWFVAGVGSAFASQVAYIHFSGNGSQDEFYTSVSSE